MNDMFVDQLLEAIDRKGAPICVGIDPIVESFPESEKPEDLNHFGDCVDCIVSFCQQVLEAVESVAPVVKLQSAYFEKYLAEGVAAYYELVTQAREMGLLVIGDVKRGDIGSTSAAYAEAHLGEIPSESDEEVTTPDAITINPFLGLDAMEPFIATARQTGKGVFVLVRTSNPGSADVQDVKCADGRTISELLADQLRPISESAGIMGAGEWSNLGAVVGATQSHTMASLRSRLPKSIFLLPGYGTQGATAEMTRAAFRNGRGAIVSASRSILYPPGSVKAENWVDLVRAAAEKMSEEIRSVVVRG